MSKYLLVLFFVIAVIAVIAMWWASSLHAPETSVPIPSQVNNPGEVGTQSQMGPDETVIIYNRPTERNFTNFFHA